MPTAKGLLVRLRALVGRGTADRELAEEIRQHLELETQKNIRLGMPPDDARRAALVAFGGVQQTVEAHREVRATRWATELAGDLRIAVRALRRAPAVTGAAVVTFALGIGATAAIFSAVRAVILRPLPFADPDRLVAVWEQNPERGWYQADVAPANYLDWQAQVPAFADAAAYSHFDGTATLTGAGEPSLLRLLQVTGNFFSVLGVRPALGHGFDRAATWLPSPAVIVLGDRAWRDRFGADPRIVGRSITLDDRKLEVVGVMPPGFAFPTPDVDAWIPTRWKPESREQAFFRRAHWMRVVARLRPGVGARQADAQLQQVAARLQRQYPVLNRLMGAGITPLHEFLVGGTRRPLLVILAAVGLLLAIACANVGNLLLVRAAGREREAAVRLALGAGRWRLVRQALVESLVLSVAGGAVGACLGIAGTRALATLQPPGMLRVRDFPFDWGVVAFVAALTAGCGVLFAVAPALWAGHRAPAEAMREGARGGSDGRRARRWGDTLVVVEVALALLLTIGAGLLVRTVRALEAVDPGFDSHDVVALTVGLPPTRYEGDASVAAFFAALAERARTLPGVSDVGLVSTLPLTEPSWSSDFTTDGRGPDGYGTEVLHREASGDYFRAMRIPVLRGRTFDPADARGAPRVVIVNEALARSYFRDEDPIGRRIVFDRVPDSTSTWRTIVGVVGSERQGALDGPPRIEIFEPYTQNASNEMTLVVRGSAPFPVIAPALRRTLASLDSSVAITSLRTMDDVRGDAMARQRFLMTLLLAFAGVGVALAVVGVYGVLAQLARRRTRELGIRIALGARATQVGWLVVGHGLRLALVGSAVGVVAALAATRALAALLYGVRVVDPLTYAVVVAVVLATSALAAWIPARRASRADPALALRAE